MVYGFSGLVALNNALWSLSPLAVKPSMYTHYFGLNEKPFSLVPNPRFLYMSEQHREALAQLHYGIQEGEGFILITGEVGAGKTTLCKCLLERITNDTNVAYIFNSKVSGNELLASICDELGISYKENSGQKILTDKIYEFLLAAHAENKNTVLIIDEAQNLQPDVLEQIRLLTNLETSEKKLLQIVLIGQPELRDIFLRSDLKQLAQRVTARYHLGPLDKEEVPLYINHRITVAGGHPPLFNTAALNKVYDLSSGIPRLINLLCNRALLAAYSENKSQVDKTILLNSAEETTAHINKVNRLSNQGIKSSNLWSSLSSFNLVLPALFLTVVGIGAIAVLNSKSSSSSFMSPEYKPAKVSHHERQPQTNAPDRVVDKSTVKKELNNSLQTNTLDRNSALNSTGTLSHPGNYSAIETKTLSYQDLLNSWNIKETNIANKGFCIVAQQNGLRCLISKGDINSLKRLNRPATLRLFSKDGSEYYIMIKAISDNLATVQIAGATMEVPIADLKEQWSGDFLLLWKAPENYSSNIKDSTSPHVEWLRTALFEANISSHSELKDFTYIAPLNEQIKSFQKSQGLEADGIAGEHTLILLNTVLGLDVPMLFSSS